MKNIIGADNARAASEETKAILCRMAEDGDDLSQPREIDFNHLFADEESAVAFSEAVILRGFTQVDCDFWDEQDEWQTSVHVTMVPSLLEIDVIETELDEMARSFDGHPDGWGCMEVVGPELP